VEALAQVSSRGWELTMVGDGPLMPKVRERIQEKKLAEFVTLAGWLDAPNVGRVLSESDVLVMPSKSEGLPVAAIEALKHGLAIVASDIPGMRDVLVDGVNGFAVPVGNLQALADKLAFLLENESVLVAMKHASWEKAREFDLGIIAEQYERVLSSACRR
jgi:glycosyltransferase involved in cell wall biosynthesis